MSIEVTINYVNIPSIIILFLRRTRFENGDLGPIAYTTWSGMVWSEKGKLKASFLTTVLKLPLVTNFVLSPENKLHDMNQCYFAVSQHSVLKAFRKTESLQVAKSQEFSNEWAIQIFERNVPLSVLNTGTIFERDLLSSGSVAKSTTQKPWVFWEWLEISES